uniref:Uncharacterized protein n=1 Tax=Spironucleus salmonicida TaxID=348837 RepID=V6LJE6_9EUKA|eukprot:EST44705.1 Hypothetical protein SS50377_15417 [Spironucleus salmonicida]
MHKHEKDHNNAQLHHNCEPALQQDIQIAQVATQFDQAEQVQVTHQHHIKEWIEDHMHHENHQIKMKDSNCDHFEKHQ